jgi:hypothetical protein
MAMAERDDAEDPGAEREGQSASQAAAAGAGRVNPQITDAVTQTNVQLLGESPAFALAMSMLNAGQANGVLYANMVHAQQQSHIAQQAATVQSVIQTFGLKR